MIKHIQPLLEAIGIGLGFLGGGTPLLSPIGPGGGEGPIVQQRLNVVLYVLGLVLAGISPHGPTVDDQKLLKVAPNAAQPIRRPSGALNPPPEGMRPGAQQVDLVGNDGGRVDPVSIFLCQLQSDELRSIGLNDVCVRSRQVDKIEKLMRNCRCILERHSLLICNM